MKNRATFIIGGSGFIGSRLCERLLASKKHRVQIIDKVRSPVFPAHCHTADVRNLRDLQEVAGALAKGSKAPILINLAAEHRDDVTPASLYSDVNVRGAENVCQLARTLETRTIIFTSTVAVYGLDPKNTDETGEIRPFNEYGRTKHAAELIYRRWHAEAPHERTLVIVRPTVVFGERNRGNVYNLLSQIAKPIFIMIGDGQNKKSMSYVGNVAAFLEHCMELPTGTHIFNYADKPDLSMRELVMTTKQLLGKSSKLYRIPYSVGYCIGLMFDLLALVTRRKYAISAIRVKKFCASTVYSSSAEATGFVPPVPLRRAIEKTVEYEFGGSAKPGVIFYSE